MSNEPEDLTRIPRESQAEANKAWDAMDQISIALTGQKEVPLHVLLADIERLAKVAAENAELRKRIDCVRIPEDGVPEDQWLVLGPAAVMEMRERLARMEKDAKVANQTLLDCGMLIRRLCHKLPPESDLSIKALDFVHRKGLGGSCLRDASPRTSTDRKES